MSLATDIAAYLQQLVDGMGLGLTAEVEETPEATRINLVGENGGALVRAEGEGLQALQHLVASAFRRQLGQDRRIVVDCCGFRRDRDGQSCARWPNS